jgi:hypothetical protein
MYHFTKVLPGCQRGGRGTVLDKICTRSDVFLCLKFISCPEKEVVNF